MVKFKGMNKMLAALLLSASMILATGVIAFAYVDESAEENKTENVESDKSKKEEIEVKKNKTNASDAFSVTGNAQVQDENINSNSKEFFTITTKNNNTFYVVIDHAANVDNVHMLSQIDENDLQEFLGEDQQGSSVVDVEPDIVIDENTNNDQKGQSEAEDSKKEEKTLNLGALAVIFIIAILGIGIYVYMKFIKPEKDKEDGDDEGIETMEENDFVEEDEESEDFDD